jgi:hypothetical protein
LGIDPARPTQRHRACLVTGVSEFLSPRALCSLTALSVAVNLSLIRHWRATALRLQHLHGDGMKRAKAWLTSLRKPRDRHDRSQANLRTPMPLHPDPSRIWQGLDEESPAIAYEVA